MHLGKQQDRFVATHTAAASRRDESRESPSDEFRGGTRNDAPGLSAAFAVLLTTATNLLASPFQLKPFSTVPEVAPVIIGDL